MYNYVETYQVPKLNQDQINYLNHPKPTKEIEAVIHSLPSKKKKKSQDQSGGFNAEFYQTFNKDLIPITFNATPTPGESV